MRAVILCMIVHRMIIFMMSWQIRVSSLQLRQRRLIRLKIRLIGALMGSGERIMVIIDKHHQYVIKEKGGGRARLEGALSMINSVWRRTIEIKSNIYSYHTINREGLSLLYSSHPCRVYSGMTRMRTIAPLSARGNGAPNSWFVSGMEKPTAYGNLLSVTQVPLRVCIHSLYDNTAC